MRKLIGAAVLALSMTGCGDEGMKRPETFLQEHEEALERVALGLQATRLMSVSSLPYDLAMKIETADGDAEVYSEIAAFIKNNEMVSIDVVRNFSDRTQIESIYFLLRIERAYRKNTAYSLVYSELENVQPPFNTSTCSKEHGKWFYCSYLLD